MSQQNALLTQEEAGHPGCGVGTKNACFAVVVSPDGMECSMISRQAIAQTMGLRTGWRVNIDASDGKAWCPKGVLDNSKKP